MWVTTSAPAADWGTGAAVCPTVPGEVGLAIAPMALVWAPVAAWAGPIASAAGISRAAAAGIGMPSAEVPGDTTDRAREAAAVAAPPVLDRVVVAEAAAAAEVGAGKQTRSQSERD
jgi:hypothetical protein